LVGEVGALRLKSFHMAGNAMYAIDGGDWVVLGVFVCCRVK
jgi:hypothetical protein